MLQNRSGSSTPPACPANTSTLGTLVAFTGNGNGWTRAQLAETKIHNELCKLLFCDAES